MWGEKAVEELLFVLIGKGAEADHVASSEV